MKRCKQIFLPSVLQKPDLSAAMTASQSGGQQPAWLLVLLPTWEQRREESQASLEHVWFLSE